MPSQTIRSIRGTQKGNESFLKRIYFNPGVRQDASRFELDGQTGTEKRTRSEKILAFLSRKTYRVVVVSWFSIYYTTHFIGKLVR